MQVRSEETRIHILAAASRLFSESGYNAAGVAELCKAAGVSKGAFYYHFPSKQALFLALLETWLSGLDAAFEKISHESQSVPQAIQAMAQMAGNVLESSDASLSIILEFWIQAYRDPKIWEAAIAPYRRYQDYFTSLLEKGMQEGSLHPADPKIAARVTVSLGLGLLLQALIDTESTQWEAVVRQCVDLLLHGLSRRYA